MESQTFAPTLTDPITPALPRHVPAHVPPDGVAEYANSFLTVHQHVIGYSGARLTKGLTIYHKIFLIYREIHLQ